MALLCLLLTTNAHAITVSVEGQGEISEQGMELTLTTPEEDILTGDMMFKVEGSLICTGQLTVSVERSVSGLSDEFCCAKQCIGGNEQSTEQLTFQPGGMADWYIHYTPANNSDVTVTYTFSDGTDSRRLTVHYTYTQDIETISGQAPKARKIIRDGLLLIEHKDKIYNL